MVTVSQIAMPAGFDMVYREAGSGGVPLLILHGLGSNYIQFEDDIEYFSKCRRVIQPDLRGHGDTGSPPHATVADFTCRKMAEDVAYLLDQLGISRVDMVGNSLGGNIALELIDLRPGLARSLTTFGTTYRLCVPKFILPIRDIIYWYLGDSLPRWAAEKTSKTPQGRDVLTRTFSHMHPRTSKLVGPNICKFDYRHVAERFEGHILLLQCKGDKDINATLKPTLQTLSKLERAKVQPFETGGHCCNVDDPDEFHRRIDAFLDMLDTQDK